MTGSHVLPKAAYVSSALQASRLNPSVFWTGTRDTYFRRPQSVSCVSSRRVRCCSEENSVKDVEKLRIEKENVDSALESSNGNAASRGNGVSVPNQVANLSEDMMIFPSRGKRQVDTGFKRGKADYARAGGVAIVVAIAAVLLQHSWVEHHRDLAMELIFVLGYLAITLEESLNFDKAGVALLMGVGVWTVLMTAADGGAAGQHVTTMLGEQLGEVSQILFFLIGAMTIVEIIDAHRGFKVVTDFITTNSRRILLWTVGVLTFFISAVLDNLTSTIVVVSLLRKLVKDRNERLLYGAATVIAANAGGAWTPIGGEYWSLVYYNVPGTNAIFTGLLQVFLTLIIFPYSLLPSLFVL